MRNATIITRALLDNSDMDRLRDAACHVAEVWDFHGKSGTKITISPYLGSPDRCIMLAQERQNGLVEIFIRKERCWLPMWLAEEIAAQLCQELEVDEYWTECPTPKCWCCETYNPKFACGSCCVALYCNPRCQRRDWRSRHRHNCLWLGPPHADTQYVDIPVAV